MVCISQESDEEVSWCRVFGWQLEVWGCKEDVHLSPHHPLSLAIDRVSITGGSAALILP